MAAYPQHTPRRTRRSHPTIGYLTPGIDDDIGRAIWSGLAETAERQGVSLFTFVGGPLHAPVDFAAQANILYSLAGAPRLDGLISWASSIGGLLDHPTISAFHQRYQPLPMVSIALPLEGIPTLIVDSYQAMRELLLHLIETHGYRRLAFIRGPETHYYAQERYRAYQDVVVEYGLPSDPALVTPPLGWGQPRGAEAVHLFLDERKLRPRHDLQAIVTASDTQALGALKAIQQRGLRVPDDIAVVGINDVRESRLNNPPLTTVAMPFYRLGQMAVETLMARLAGQTVSAVEVLSAQLMVRQSCGCPDVDVQEAAIVACEPLAIPSSTGLAIHRPHLLAAMQAAMRDFPSDAVDPRPADLLHAFLADLEGSARGGFLRALDTRLDQATTSSGISAWHRIVSALRRELSPHLDGAMRQAADNLWQQARVVIGKRSRRLEAYRRLQVEQQAQSLQELGAALTTATHVQGLMDVLADRLPLLGIPSAYVALYEAPHRYAYPLPPPDYARLRVAYDAKGRIGLEAEGRRFPTRDLTPDGLLPGGRHSYIVEALYHQDHPLGFALFETGPHEGTLYEALRVQISGALRGVQLLEQNVYLYQQALEAQKAAQAGQRLAEEANLLKSRFLSMVSHELLTPLVMLVGLSEMMLREGSRDRPALPDPYRQDLQRIHVSARQLGSLVRDVLDLARSQVGQLKLAHKPVALGEVLTAVAQVGEQMAREKGLTWRADLPSALPYVLGDSARLHQVTLNLVANAIKFTTTGQVTLHTQQDSHNITILVSDTGLGVPVTEQEAIFDLFRQSERTAARGYGGLGIGLAICRQLVELHGGHMGLRSSGDEYGGSTFYFSLPILPATVADASHAPPPSQRVLVLTEWVSGGVPLVNYLRQQGYAVESVGIREHSDWLGRVLAEPPGALVLDSPVTALAWEVITPLKENPATQDIPLLFYALDAKDDSGALLPLDYATKPLGWEALTHTVQRYGLTASNGEPPGILVVDDDPGILELHSRLVRTAAPDCRLLQAANGRIALDILRQAQPALVLLDLMMPELDGFGVLEAIQADDRLRHTPVIILTAQTLSQADMTRLNQGVAAVLSKGLLTVEETLTHIEQALGRHKALGSEAQRVVRKAMAFIQTHYAEALTRDEVAEYVGVSARHLTRCFDEELGLSPMIYLNRFRILEAKRRLQQGGQTITAIALAVGFSNSSYFTEVFRREVGVSPRDYQRGEIGI